jgi:hypothetical protein
LLELQISISVYFHEVSSINTDCINGFVQIHAGNDKNRFSFALVVATKNNLLSSSICSKLDSCNQSQAIASGNFSLSIILFPSQFQLYRPGIKTVLNSSHFDP